MVSNALVDGQISEEEIKTVLDELDMYNYLKVKTHEKRSKSDISNEEKKKILKQGKAQSLEALRKDRRCCLIGS